MRDEETQPSVREEDVVWEDFRSIIDTPTSRHQPQHLSQLLNSVGARGFAPGQDRPVGLLEETLRLALLAIFGDDPSNVRTASRCLISKVFCV